MKTNLSQTGLSFIELLCTLVIIAIITSIAYPSYSEGLMKIKHTEAKSALLELQNQYERYFMTHNSYEDAKIGTDVNALINQTITKNGNYQLEISEQKEDYYLLSAHPNSNSTIQDKVCASFTLNSLGEQNVSGSGNAYQCWNR